MILRRDPRPVWALSTEGDRRFAWPASRAGATPSGGNGILDVYLELVARIPVTKVRSEPGLDHLDAIGQIVSCA